MAMPGDGVVPQLDEFDFDPLQTDWMAEAGFGVEDEEEQLLSPFVFPENDEFLVPGNLNAVETKPGYEENVPLVPTMDAQAYVDVPDYSAQMALNHKSQRALRQAKRKASEQLANGATKKRETEKPATTTAGSTDGNSANKDSKGTTAPSAGSKGEEKDVKRAKRLLRNRVSAQQARERKKYYVSNLEKKAKDLEEKVSQMEARINKLEHRNQALSHKLESHGIPADV
eukprot:jgi/Pico_ML_1/51802/g2649.t1